MRHDVTGDAKILCCHTDYWGFNEGASYTLPAGGNATITRLFPGIPVVSVTNTDTRERIFSVRNHGDIEMGPGVIYTGYAAVTSPVQNARESLPAENIFSPAYSIDDL